MHESTLRISTSSPDGQWIVFKADAMIPDPALNSKGRPPMIQIITYNPLGEITANLKVPRRELRFILEQI
jgi:Tol biopolymer transport system component